MSARRGSLSAQHVQEACLNGWPALRETVFDGWLVRFAGGYTRRSNSVNLLSPGTRDPDEKLRVCETLYAAQGLPAIVCVPSMAEPSISHALDRRGYGPPEDETRVLSMAFEETSSFRREGVDLEEGLPGEAWLRALARLQGQGEAARQTHRKILEALAIPAVFASVPGGGGRPGALAFGAVHDGLVCVNSVVTNPEFRRRGLAGRAISGILHWAQSRQGATGACVPVVAGNAPAVALYEGLGFQHEVFRYHYRRRAGGA
jgi:GNAT superfamily N-acetyltransferase